MSPIVSPAIYNYQTNASNFHNVTLCTVLHSTKQTMSNHLLNYHDAIIYPSDLALLDSPSDWLNDAVINFQMTRLQQTQNERRKSGQKRRRDDGEVVVNQHLFLDP